MREITSAAFTRALSDLYGIDPWPGVPRTRSRVHCEPFSAVMIGSFGAPAPSGNRAPPNSVTRKSQRTSSHVFSVSHCAPCVPSASSSATAE